MLCHRRTPPEELKYFAKRADILITATGIVNFIKPDLIKPGACVIDVGINRITTPDGKQKLVGDVDYDGKHSGFVLFFKIHCFFLICFSCKRSGWLYYSSPGRRWTDDGRHVDEKYV